MPYIHSVTCKFPDNYYSQEELLEGIKKRWDKKFHNFERIEAFYQSVLVGGRHMALPIERYNEDLTFKHKNNAWIEVSTKLATSAITELLDSANISAKEISLLMSTTVTGISVPSIEARVMNNISFDTQTKRLPIFGLGCLAGAAGINRACDYLKGHPKEAAVFFSVELCSLTVILEDLSIPNIISTGLFGDGCAAVLLVGDQHPLAKESPLEFKYSQSAFFENTERIMGWDVGDNGFKVVLSNQVPEIVFKHFPNEFNKLLKTCDLQKEDIIDRNEKVWTL